MAAGLSLLRPCLVCATVAMMACGETSSTTREPPAADTNTASQNRPTNTEKACDLLTKADAEAALGSSIEDVTDESRPTPVGDKVLRGFCYYEGDGGSVSLTVNKHIDGAFAAERFAGFKQRYDGDESYRPLPGLGEDAFAEREELLVKRGDLILIIELKREGPDKPQHYGDKPALDRLAAAERKIAAEALSRLPGAGS